MTESIRSAMPSTRCAQHVQSENAEASVQADLNAVGAPIQRCEGCRYLCSCVSKKVEDILKTKI